MNSQKIKSRGQWRLLLLLTSPVVLTLLALWLGNAAASHTDPLFHGKRESEWISQLKYNDDQQVEEWRGYGEEGVQVLIRGLERETHPGQRAYRRFYRLLPALVRACLPEAKPDSTQATRECLVSLLRSLGKDAKSAIPAMIRTARNDEAIAVRQGAIGYFTPLLDHLPASEKKSLLPALINAMQHAQLRHNATILLRFYPEERELVTPVLLRALQDSEAYVRLYAAQALNRVAPEVAKKAGATPILVALAKNPDDQLASKAVQALGDLGSEPELAVPALMECLQSTNGLIFAEAVWILERTPREFYPYAETIIPALRNAADRKDRRTGGAKYALSKWESRPK